LKQAIDNLPGFFFGRQGCALNLAGTSV
jgi:hypothetical protein